MFVIEVLFEGNQSWTTFYVKNFRKQFCEMKINEIIEPLNLSQNTFIKHCAALYMPIYIIEISPSFSQFFCAR